MVNVASADDNANVMEEMAKRVRKRQGVQNKLKRIMKYAESLSESTATDIEVCLDSLKPLLDEFENTQIKIEDICDPNSFDTQEGIREEFERSYWRALATLKQTLKEKINSASTSNDKTATAENSAPLSKTNLPRIPIPEFNGKIEDYPAFMDLFDSIVHSNTTVSDVDKLHYLKTAVKDEAAQLIQSLATIAENYATARSMLETRYRNKKVLINTYLRNIVEERSLSQETAQGLKRVLDNFSKNIQGLKNCGEKTDTWDSFLVFLISCKFDGTTRREWELNSPQTTPAKFEEVREFLEKRVPALEATGSPKSADQGRGRQNPTATKTFAATQSCVVCNESHAIYFCEQFKKLTVEERLEIVRDKRLCYNCLSASHRFNDCKSTDGCKKCGLRHHSMIHYDKFVKKPAPTVTDQNVSATAQINLKSNCVLLSTISLIIKNDQGQSSLARALFDPGSQSHYITPALVRKLNLPVRPHAVEISGIASAKSFADKITSCTLESRVSNFSMKIDCIILSDITPILPSQQLDQGVIRISNLELADPKFHIPGTIDLLIGAELFIDVLQPGKIINGENRPALQNTAFGWIVSGNYENPIATTPRTNTHLCRLADNIKAFWEIEECARPQKLLSKDEIECEEHFSKSFKLLSSGQYSVRLPFKQSPDQLGESRSVALKILTTQLKNLSPEVKSKYRDHMQEYLDLGHMRKLKPSEIKERPNFYMPHHAVLKSSSLTTKLRVVYNASKKTSSGFSLNDILRTGPTIQENLFNILLRFRQYKIAFCADLEKMYRQIQIHPDDQKFQRILWENPDNNVIEDYALTTVTFGVTTAPFLAVRTTQQAANENEAEFPKGARVIKRDFYVDDLISGSDDEQEAIDVQIQLIQILKKGGFTLRKWVANKPELLQCDHTCRIESFTEVSLYHDEPIKTLGLTWNPTSDLFRVHVELPPINSNITKRIILAEASKLFDPLGLLTPVILIPKILIQKLWLSGADWDTPLDGQLKFAWLQFRENLAKLSCFIERHALASNNSEPQLHGFCDASQDAYSAAFYLRSTKDENEITIRLLCAKSRVAPLKPVSIPRLELCGAVLLMKLYKTVRESLSISIGRVFLWTDSTIVLHWLAQPPHIWKTFVSNRVADIQSATEPEMWRYVPTNFNPADIASRGLCPSKIQDCTRWWKGPEFLMSEEIYWPKKIVASLDKQDKERRRDNFSFMSTNDCDLFSKFSELNKLVRVTAYCLRFNKLVSITKDGLVRVMNKQTNPLNAEEIQHSTNCLIKKMQKEAFAREVRELNENGAAGNKSCLKSLSPFIDQEGFVRVGGRLENKNCPFSEKHPILLAKGHPLTKLIIRYEHKRNLHAAPQLLLSIIRERYWIINARNAIRQEIRHCLRCQIFRAQSKTQLMGMLPEFRVNANPAFKSRILSCWRGLCGPLHTSNGWNEIKILSKGIHMFVRMLRN